MSAQPGVYRRCACRDETTGKQFGKRCSKLERNSKHGLWYYAVQVDGKMLRRGGYATKTEAADARAGVQTRADRGITINDRETTEQYLRATLAGARHLRPKTHRTYADHVERIWVPRVGRIPLDKLRHGHVDAAVTALMEDRDDLSISSVARYLATLRALLGVAVKVRRLSDNPAAHIQLPAYETAEVVPWTPTEVGAFLVAVHSERLAALYELVALTGLRRGEVAALRWTSVDMARGFLVVRANRVDVGGQIIEGAPKTRAGKRFVELGRAGVDVLTGWRAAQQLEAAEWGPAWDDSGYVFTRVDGKPLRPEYITRTFRRLTTDAGLRRIRLHDLRHYAVSAYAMANVAPTIIAQQVGHTKLLRAYEHMFEGFGSKGADAAAALIPRPTTHQLLTPAADSGETAPTDSDKRGATCRNRTDDLLITSWESGSTEAGDPR